MSSFEAVQVADVATMDKLTAQELDRQVTEEPLPDKQCNQLGHLLPTIFQSFQVEPPHTDELLIYPSEIIHRDERIDNQFRHKTEMELVSLWDTQAEQWNWALPRSHRSNQPTTEHIFAAFFNALTKSLARINRLSAMRSSGNRVWSGLHSTVSIKGEGISRKPDIIMSDEPDARWATIKVVAELTSSEYQPADRAAKSLDTKAYLILRHQPWRRFAFMLSFCNKYHELRVHTYDRSGGTVSPPYDIVKQKDIFIRIFSSIVFGNDECIGFDMTMNIREPNIFMPSHHSRIPQKLRSRKKKYKNPNGPDLQSLLHDPSSSTTDFKTPEDHETNSHMPFESEEARSEVRTAPAQLPPAPPTPGAADSILPTDLGTADSVLHTLTSEPPNQVPIGKIQVNKNTYDILKLVFSGHGLVGRGTVCYLARRDNQEYIVKDHWVLGSVDDSEVLNEVTMMEKMKGVPGVPELVEYCQVILSSGDIDNTRMYRYKERESTEGTWRTHVRLVMKPRGRRLEEFRTKREFVQALRDIVIIQKTAVQDRKILHRDGSLHNAMIVDGDDGSSKGMLIDWEFAVDVDIANDHRYNHGGTGTVPFMSRALLGQMVQVDSDARNSQHVKNASMSKARAMHPIKQDFTDDLESVFYVFLWICIMFSGPLGEVRQWKLKEGCIPYEWNRRSLRLCQSSKVMFFARSVDGLNQFDPYFYDLLPLARDWTNLLKFNFAETDANGEVRTYNPVTFEGVIEILDKHLALLPDNEPSPEHVLRKRAVEEQIKEVQLKDKIIKDMHSTGIATQKRVLDDVRTVEPAKRCRLNNFLHD